MNPNLTCPACGYRLAMQASRSSENCPRCGTGLVDEREISQDSIATQSPAETMEDLSDLEFSSSFRTHDVQAEEAKTTNPREREESQSEITDRQGKDSQGARLVLQGHLATLAKAPTGVQTKGPSKPRKKEKVRQPAPMARSSAKSSSSHDFFSTFGSILLVCVIFLAWVVYDRTGRPASSPPSTRTEAILSQAVTSFREGDSEIARELVQRAIDQDPTSQLAIKLAELFQEPK